MKYIPLLFIIFAFAGCEKKDKKTTLTAKVITIDFKDPIIKSIKLIAYVKTDQGYKFLRFHWICSKKGEMTLVSKRQIRATHFLLKIAKKRQKKIRFKVTTKQLNNQTYYVCADEVELVE